MFKLSFVQKAIFILSSPAPEGTSKLITYGRYTLGNKLQQHVTATHCSDKLLCVYWRNFVKTFVSATEFCCSNMS